MPASADTRVFLDTNVFLYAAGGDHPLRAPCGELLTRVGSGDLDATTSTEVVQELLYVLTRRNLRSEAQSLASAVQDMFPDVLPVTHADMRLTCQLLADHPSLPVRDAVHCAVMITNGITRIISADTHFDSLPDIQRIDPAG
jgi:predicted nucleic acid-binding protein